MTQDTFLLLIGGGLAAIALAFVAASWFHRGRSRFLRRAGRRLGLTPLEAGKSFHFEPVALLRKRGRGIGAALRGTWQGRSIMVFDLFHPVANTMTMQTVLMLEAGAGRLPEFAAIPRHPNLYAPTMDLRPVEPAPPGLGGQWHLYSRNGRWPFGPPLTEWLAQKRSARWSLEGTGEVLYVYRRATLAGTRDLRRWIDEAVAEALAFEAHASRASA